MIPGWEDAAGGHERSTRRRASTSPSPMTTGSRSCAASRRISRSSCSTSGSGSFPSSTTSSRSRSARWRPSTSCAPRSATPSRSATRHEARHVFGDRIIDFATANATVELPEVMIANEIEIMRDELRNRLAQQRIGLDQYLAMAKQTPEELAAELRDPATRRVKTLLVLSAIAEKEGIDATDAEIDAEVGRAAGALRRRAPAPRVPASPARPLVPAHDAAQPYTRRDARSTARWGPIRPRRTLPDDTRASTQPRSNRVTDARPDGHRDAALAASAPSTSTRGSSRSGSSSWASRSRTTSPT